MSSWHNIYLFIYHMILVSAIVFCKSIFNCIDSSSSYSFYDEYNSIRLQQELYAIFVYLVFTSCLLFGVAKILTSLVWSPNKNLYVSKVNKTQYFRLRLYWLLFWCSECSLSASLLLTYSWMIVWRFEPEWWRLTALDKLEPNGRDISISWAPIGAQKYQ